MTSVHFDKITELGFYVEICWNKSLTISYHYGDNEILILYSDYNIKSFENFLELCIDFFYEWYNKNYKILDKLELTSDIEYLDQIENSVLGNITKRLNRELNLDKLL
jgi:hypothetical protein